MHEQARQATRDAGSADLLRWAGPRLASLPRQEPRSGADKRERPRGDGLPAPLSVALPVAHARSLARLRFRCFPPPRLLSAGLLPAACWPLARAATVTSPPSPTVSRSLPLPLARAVGVGLGRLIPPASALSAACADTAAAVTLSLQCSPLGVQFNAPLLHDGAAGAFSIGLRLRLSSSQPFNAPPLTRETPPPPLPAFFNRPPRAPLFLVRACARRLQFHTAIAACVSSQLEDGPSIIVHGGGVVLLLRAPPSSSQDTLPGSRFLGAATAPNKKMNYLIRSRSLKRLLSLGRRSNADESAEDQCADVVDPPPPPNKPTWRCFSYDELHQATNGFHQDNMVGKGGYGEVYRGVLDDGRAVAVKRLAPAAAADEKKEKDFLTELGTVGHVRHPNVSALLGCCVDRGLHLVFEFSTRGSVSANLHDLKLPAMSWKQRHGIAVGTARGLRYLHKGCARRIIHRDIKASNILLTADYEPQISDFGLARWLPSEWTHHAIAPIEGTFGCLAPEYFTHGIVDEKTDVFAFGVFLLELISGRKPVDGSHMSLIAWAKPYLTDGVVQGLVDPRLGDGYDAGQLRRLMFVASICVRAAAAWRPTMTQVLELLESCEISQDQWQMPEKEEQDELWDFDDLDDFEDDDDDDHYDDESDSPSISSSACSIHPND